MWKWKCYQNPYGNDESGDIYCHDAFEEGADAMLQALKDNVDSIKVKKRECSETPSMIISGTWAFIPDEK